MKVINRLLATVLYVWHLPFVKYGLIVVLGVVLVGFVGENSMLAHMRNKLYISELTEEIEKYNARSREDIRQLRELSRNPKAIERIARERYFMKHDDEDIFVLSDDDRAPQMIADYDETAE